MFILWVACCITTTFVNVSSQTQIKTKSNVVLLRYVPAYLNVGTPFVVCVLLCSWYLLKRMDLSQDLAA